MVVRTPPTVEGVLLATPIFREFRLRFPNERLVVEIQPFGASKELLWGNRNISEVGMFFEPGKSEKVVRLDVVDFRSEGHLMDAYAIELLGDSRLACRQMEMFTTEEQEEEASVTRAMMNGKVAVVALPIGSFAAKCTYGVSLALCAMGYEVIPVDGRPRSGWGALKAIVDRADLFVGADDRPETMVAATTDTPMAVAYSWRDPSAIKPFRRGVPFEAVCPGLACPEAPSCRKSNARGEFCYMWFVSCRNDDPVACEKSLTTEKFIEAIRKVVSNGVEYIEAENEDSHRG